MSILYFNYINTVDTPSQMIHNDILYSPGPPHFFLILHNSPPLQLRGGGGWNAIQYQIVDPLINQISDITPPRKSNIRYPGTPVSPPPPPPPPPH